MFRWPISHSILFLLMVEKPFNVFLISSRSRWKNGFLCSCQYYRIICLICSRKQRETKNWCESLWLNSTPYRIRIHTLWHTHHCYIYVLLEISSWNFFDNGETEIIVKLNKRANYMAHGKNRLWWMFYSNREKKTKHIRHIRHFGEKNH